MSAQNLFEPDPKESLFGGDPRDRFQMLRSAVQVFLNKQTDSGDHQSPEIVAAARLLRLLLDRKIGNGYPPASQSPAVVEMLVDGVLWNTLGRHLG